MFNINPVSTQISHLKTYINPIHGIEMEVALDGGLESRWGVQDASTPLDPTANAVLPNFLR